MFDITLLADPAVVTRFLSVDRARHAYMIGDLALPYWAPALFYGAFASDHADDHASDPMREPALRAVVLVYAPIQPPPVISAGDPVAVDAILEYLTAHGLVAEIMFHTLPEHMPALEHYFAIAGEPIPMWRMAITHDRLQAIAPKQGAVRRLIGTDASAVQALYDSGYPEDFMSGRPHITPDLLENGIFYGAFSDSAATRLASIAGTHIFTPAERISTVGYVFTAPDQRGHGYATAATSAVTGHLFAHDIDLVVLNVKQINTPAIRAYERIGYTRHNALYEGYAKYDSERSRR